MFAPPSGSGTTFGATLYVYDNGAGTGSTQTVAITGEN